MTPFQEAQALGFAAMTGARSGARNGARRGVVTGFTAPVIIYENMRAIDQDAARLDGNVNAYVADPVFRSAWAGWLVNWRAFRDRYLDSNAAKLGAVFYTDDLARQVEIYRQQLAGWYADYTRQASTTGTPVPQISSLGIPPLAPGQRTGPQGQSEPLLPWWAWMVVGVAAVGGGYFVYRRYVAPRVSSLFGGGSSDDDRDDGGDRRRPARLSRASVPESDVPPWMQHDPDGLESYAQDPRATMRYAPPPPPALPPPAWSSAAALPQHGQGVYYRPYDHPHLVAARDRQRAAFARREPPRRALPPHGWHDPDPDLEEFDE